MSLFPAHSRASVRLASRAVLVAVLLATPIAGPLDAGSTGSTQLHTPQGSGAGTGNGDYVTAAAGMNTVYRYWVEVPPSLSRLRIQIFDADIGDGAGEAAAGRDRARGTFDTTATYSLFDPSGTARPIRFTTGDTTTPAGGDNAWLSLYDGNGASVADNFGTAAYSNNNGTANWAANWIETDNNGGGATGGFVMITGGQLRIGSNGGSVTGNPSLEREADLLGTPGLNFQNAYLTLTFTTSGNLEDADTWAVQASSNGGSSWTTLENFFNDSTGSRSYDMTTYRANNTRVRFISTGGFTNTSEFFFIDNVSINDGGTLTAGHWEVRVAQSAGGDSINAIGLRADDGDATSSGTELNLYYDSHVQIGVNPPSSGTQSRSYTMYPYLTSGCSCSKNDHDYDDNSGSTGTMTLTSRTAAFSQSYLDGSFSTDDAWRRDTFSGFTSDTKALDYGIWTEAVSISSYLVGGTPNGNYANIYFGNFQAAGNPPTANPSANTFRVYLPTDAGAAPVKTYLNQEFTYEFGPNPPAVGQTTTVTVTVRLVNPETQAITFSAANLVTANIPAVRTTYGGNAQVSQGTITAQPAVGGTGNITWNPGTVAAGATVLLSYRVNITPTAAGQRTTITSTPASGNGTRATFVDSTGNTTQARATYTVGPLCELAVTQGIVLTPALLGSLRLLDLPQGPTVEWTTVSEAGTAGFYLESIEDKAVRRVSGFVKAFHSAPQGGAYRVLDPARPRRQPGTYQLVEIGVKGERKTHGPFLVSPVSGDAWSPGDPGVGTQGAGQSRPGSIRPGPKVPEPARPQLGLGSAVKIEIVETGIYRLSAEDLAATTGLDAATVQQLITSGSVSLSNQGRPVAYTPDEAGGLLFYGQKLDSIYAARNVYWLRLTSGPRMRETSAKATPSAMPATLRDRITFEQDQLPATVLPLDSESDYWFWDYLLAGDPEVGHRSFLLSTPAPTAKPASPSTLAVGLQGATSTGVEGEHHVRVLFNGSPLGEAQWTGIAPYRAAFKLTAPFLESGNTLELVAILDPGAPYSVTYLDDFEVTYERVARAVGSRLEANELTSGDGGPVPSLLGGVTVEGFADPGIVILDVADPASPVRVRKALVDSGPQGFRASFAAGKGRYSLASRQGFREPARLALDLPSNLLGSPADHVIVTTAALRGPAETLAAHRSAQGLSSVVVDIEDVYDELSFGIPTPHALKDFLKAAWSRWGGAPRYVLLAGNGDYDYRDVLGLGRNLVPPLMLTTPSGLFPSDGSYGDATGADGIPEIAVGRVTVLTPGELAGYVSKVIAQESLAVATSQPALLLADDPEGGNDFGADSDAMAQNLAPGLSITTAYLGPASLAVVRDTLASTWAQGPALVSYVGHGGLDRFSQEGILTSDDVATLPAAARLPVVSALTCTVNRFGIPGFQALGELLVNRADGGATAVWAPSGLSEHAQANLLGKQYQRTAWGQSTERIGDAVRQALGTFASLGGSRDMLRLYTLLGDPAFRPVRPQAAPSSGSSGE